MTCDPPIDSTIEERLNQFLDFSSYGGCPHELDCFSIAKNLQAWYHWWREQQGVETFMVPPTPWIVPNSGIAVTVEEDDGYPD